ncbi:MAG: TonB-dependent receptor [Proteobacteria bacterium]|nr:TonB-dependent receptor [Pseudomonadota bacterium]
MHPLIRYLPLLFLPQVHAETAPADLERITVTANRIAEPESQSVYSVIRLQADEIVLMDAAHPNELFSRVPGTWISRGSGQEHLTAIRSPVLTGAGACGAFLFLEDSIPVRPVGFCNVNQLFEINTEQADAIEVLRGPGSVHYGSNALHGAINVLHAPLRLPLNEVALTFGEFGQRRIKVDHGHLLGENSWRMKYFGETADSIQRDAGHRQHKLNLGWQGYNVRTHLAATSLDQDTAGYIIGEDAYRNPDLKRGNPNPEAFRRAQSLRAWAVWERELPDNRHFEMRPYARYSDMDFLQHFLPGKPLEENGQTSAGIVSSYGINGLSTDWTFGFDLEWADGWLRESQDSPVEIDSDFLQATRPVGRHYDYEVVQYSASPWINVEHAMTKRTSLVGGLRADWIRYDYDNLMSDGNLREDGTACGFGGCIYNRPADRNDSFSNISPKLGIRHALTDHTLYGNIVRGFRAPQATELYRLQRGQNVADLDAVRADSAEIGLRELKGDFTYNVALFLMEKRNEIFRDAEGFNVSSARSRHRGAEFDLNWQVDTEWQLALRGTLARHTYAFDYLPDEGESFVEGRDIDTAPRVLGSALLRWTPATSNVLELEYSRVGGYYLDAENTARYPGHGLWHLRAQHDFGNYRLRARINNLLDADYAERADFAFGEFRYFPGWPRRFTFEVAYGF